MADFDEDLQKHRRNLILISVALIVFDFADVKIAKVGILGTDLVVGNPSVLIAVAWISWLYFLLRYFQYWSTNNARKISLTYHNHLRLWFNLQAQKIDPNALQTRAVDLDSSARRFKIVERFANTRAGMDTKVLKEFSLPETLSAKAKAAFHVAVVSPHFVDQIFPFVVAILAPLATTYTQWQSIKAVIP
ncbi:hypothetical protein FNZ56_01555 [Pseudoluteimonas lycopersici]|uniref:Uncharacterized protein n=1 Tax=Pseudoluteimonas lycopersici TaxID=1324796 RepID=A0A516V2A2_9GAMM|nr:hypothetical protein [Lysobacter lycopersici]QDQ72653.1 hypothetical protein FNZ56_01555 [Lysobacter lycopersici]